VKALPRMLHAAAIHHSGRGHRAVTLPEPPTGWKVGGFRLAA
jgi:hypothetical protein